MALLSGFLNDEHLLNEEKKVDGSQVSSTATSSMAAIHPPWWMWMLCFLVFSLALAARLYFIYHVGNPENAGLGWYGDTYHRWQIAYLSKEVGFGKSFLRLWDLKGMEYFWGIFHPILTSFLFSIFGSTNILIIRLTSVFFGCLTCVWLFILGNRYFNIGAGLALGVFAALFPVAIFNDATGSLEPIGISLMLAGICCWPNFSWATGILWALAAMSRAEAWIFSAGLIFACLLARQVSGGKKIALLVGWMVMMGLYMKILLDRTGNPIYPFWWNFLANAKGEWENAQGITPFQIKVRPYYIAAFIASLPFLIYAVIARPKSYLLTLLGWGNIAFVGMMMGLTSYLKSVVPYFWMIRFFVWPYIFAAGWLMWSFIGVLPKWLRSRSLIFSKIVAGFGVVLAVCLCVFSQIMWRPIIKNYLETQPNWQKASAAGKAIADIYQDGVIWYPESSTELLYFAAQALPNLSGRVVSQMYDSFAYPPFTEYKENGLDLFGNWEKDRHLVLEWIKKEQVSLLLVPAGRDYYLKLVSLEPWLFSSAGSVSGYGTFSAYYVNRDKI
ncbi:hypothetical protein COT52_02225 [candidate division WWE3 bacterium CG08_land_8_20_14_0_20_43_13]|uniref:Glycosyltransferase RgtA/B/C/D-like domain-containing protein n=1 Tax=candidate division WWE3 bacterium CG08_land_8_20_14_0_20_43_13 TaxID=1975087 RepID=A0A2H0X980_UNCKA|nr:MAG: hypothetical protein COT52_02225 [candidate division WWE3 bacterium CG08_land_8_20_14_0_20_43_13]